MVPTSFPWSPPSGPTQTAQMCDNTFQVLPGRDAAPSPGVRVSPGPVTWHAVLTDTSATPAESLQAQGGGIARGLRTEKHPPVTLQRKRSAQQSQQGLASGTDTQAGRPEGSEVTSQELTSRCPQHGPLLGTSGFQPLRPTELTLSCTVYQHTKPYTYNLFPFLSEFERDKTHQRMYEGQPRWRGYNSTRNRYWRLHFTGGDAVGI